MLFEFLKKTKRRHDFMSCVADLWNRGSRGYPHGILTSTQRKCKMLHFCDCTLLGMGTGIGRK